MSGSAPNFAIPRRMDDPVRAALAANGSIFAAAFAFSALISVLGLTVSIYMLQVYDRVLSSRSEETLLLLTLVAFGSLAALAVLDSLRLQLLTRVGMRVADTLSANVLRAMVATSSHKGGTYDGQGLRDIDSLRSFIGSAAFAALLDAPFIVLFIAVLFLLHWAFVLLVLMGGAILVGIALINQASTATVFKRSLAVQGQAHALAEDGLHNADVLEGMGMSSTLVSRWRTLWLESLRLGLAAADKDARLTGISKAVRQLIQVALLGLGALLVLDFRATGGVMIAASILGGRALAPIESVVATWKNVVVARLAWARLAALLETAPKREEGMALPPPLGALQVEKASYISPNTRKAILSSISFELRAGESLGIIGPSASGKSTLVRLLIGAWPAMSGSIRLDGADIYAWPRHHLSRYIGYLPQDVELFSGTVRDNIARLGDGSPEEIVKAAKLANTHEMILALPKGYDTEIGKHGHQLSAGTRQRIALARALYGEPRLVVLDEPNANLDSAGDDALLATLSELKRQGITVIVVAHRPIIVEKADKILVLREGTVDAFGSRSEIVQRYVPRAVSGATPQHNVLGTAPRPQTAQGIGQKVGG